MPSSRSRPAGWRFRWLEALRHAESLPSTVTRASAARRTGRSPSRSWVLVAIATKGVAGVYATYVQASLAGEVGAALRLELLDALLTVHHLRRPRQGDHGVQVAPTAQGVAALTDRVREIEAGLATGMLGGARAIAQLVPAWRAPVGSSPREWRWRAAAAQATFGWMLGRVAPGTARRCGRRPSTGTSSSKWPTSRCDMPSSGRPTAPRRRRARACARWGRGSRCARRSSRRGSPRSAGPTSCSVPARSCWRSPRAARAG